jgi:predicted metal-dependent hydrolase
LPVRSAATRKRGGVFFCYTSDMQFSYTLRENPRARRITVTVLRDGTVRVTKPRRVSVREVERFVERCGDWIERAQKQFARLPKTSHIETSKKEYEKCKAAAHELAQRRVAHFNTFYRVPVSKIIIRNQKSRWGSCSRNGVLSFNYRILFLPPHLADYIVVHELCHLHEMNHSKRFWALVAHIVPNYHECRRELNKIGHSLLRTS